MTTKSKAQTSKTTTRGSRARTPTTPKPPSAKRSSRIVAAAVGKPTDAHSVRPGSKQALLIARLAVPGGARITDLTEELNWLPHTVRAALTRLRQQGFAVTRSRNEDGDTIYRATRPAAETAKKRFGRATKTAA